MSKKRLIVVLSVLILVITACSDGITRNEETDNYKVRTEVLEGRGSIDLEPEKASYKAKEEVKVTASPDSGYKFKGWSQTLAGKQSSRSIVVDDNLIIGAKFALGEQLKYIEIKGSGAGRVVVTKKDGEQLYLPQPEEGSVFVGWKVGDDFVGYKNSENITEVELIYQTGYHLADSDHIYTAIFAEKRDNFSISSDYAGGKVELEPDRKEYQLGTPVTIEAKANNSHDFKGWQGDIWFLSESEIKNPKLDLIIGRDIPVDEGIILYPNFEIVETDLTLNITGEGSVERSPDKEFYEVGEKVKLTANANDDQRYEFVKWSGDIGDNKPQDKEIEVEIKEDMDITAGFNVKTYKVEFRDHKEVVKEDEVEHGESAQPPYYNPKRRGYQFIDWDTDFTEVTSDLIVGAIFGRQAGALNLTIEGSGNVDITPEKLEYKIGDELTLRATGDQAEGYEFVKWSGDISNHHSKDKEIDIKVRELEVNEGMTVIAQFELETYQVEFRDHRGKIETQQVVHGESADAPNARSKKGYEFIGWDKEFDNITSELIVRAEFEKEEYTVESTLPASANGEIEIKSNNGYLKDSFEYGETVVLEAVADEGYEFKGWMERNGNVSGSTNPTSLTVERDLFVQASFEKQEHTITVDKEGEGRIDGTGTYKHGAEVILEAKPATGWKFVNWEGNDLYSFTDLAGKELESPAKKDAIKLSEGLLDRDKNLRVQFEKKSYQVTFKNHDDEILDKIEVKYREEAKAPDVPDREGYEFDGWDKEIDSVTKDLTVTAQFKIKTYDVVFKNYDGEELKIINDVEHGETVEAPDVPNREEYEFDGWDKEFDEVTKDLTVTAQFKIKTYDVVFKNYNGAILKETEVEHGEEAQAPKVPERRRYEFTGWSKEFNNVTENLTVTAQFKRRF